MDRIKRTCATCRRLWDGCIGSPGNYSWCWSPSQGELMRIIKNYEEMLKALEEKKNG